MILTNQYIQNNKDKFVLENVTEAQFSQNSIDLSLGQYIFLDSDSVTQDLTDRYDLITNAKNFDKSYYKINISKQAFILKPGMFVLAYTDEWIGAKANTNICWQFLLKSTSARNGLNHNLAGWIETGYFSPLCLELFSLVPVSLKHKQLIGQAVFHLTTDNSVDYSIRGSYQSTNDLDELKKTWKPEDILPGPNKFKA